MSLPADASWRRPSDCEVRLQQQTCNRTRSSQRTHTMGTASAVLDYGYNPSGQVTSIAANDNFYLAAPPGALSIAYTSNKLNQYTARDGQVVNHDLNGNLTAWSAPGSGAHGYSYDAQNRLRTASVPGKTIAYDYDPLGRRVSKTVNGTTTSYLLDGDEEIAEYSGSTLLRRYIHGPGIDERIARAEGSSTTNPPKTYYHVNHQGSVIAVTNAAGAIDASGTQRFAYDAYGNLASGAPTTGEPYRYTGRRYDEESGLYYYRARYYSPVLGRFLQTDPIGYADDANLYAYVANDPVNLVDPTGETLQEIVVTGSRYRPPPLPAWLIGLGGIALIEPTPVGEVITGLATAGYFGYDFGQQLTNVLDESAEPGTNEAVDEVVRDISAGGEDKGKHIEVDKRGSGDQQRDFERLSNAAGSGARTVNTSYGPGKVVDLPGGGTASTRLGSSKGAGTIQINRPGQDRIKIRY